MSWLRFNLLSVSKCCNYKSCEVPLICSSNFQRHFHNLSSNKARSCAVSRQKEGSRLYQPESISTVDLSLLCRSRCNYHCCFNTKSLQLLKLKTEPAGSFFLTTTMTTWSSSKGTYQNSESMMMEQSQLIVGHDETNNYFFIHLDEDGANSRPTAKLEYAWIEPNLVDMFHTIVPPEFRGHGLAKVLAKAAFDFFCERNVTMRPSCTYLQKYLKENPHPLYLDHIVKDFM